MTEQRSDATQGLFDRNDISNSRLAGVWIRQGADPAFVRNTIRDGRDVGVFIYNEGNVLYVTCLRAASMP